MATEKKKCSECQKFLPINEFNKNKQSKDGLFCKCKTCLSSYLKGYYGEHKEGHLEKGKAYYSKNKNTLFVKQKEHYIKNRVELNKRQTIYNRKKRYGVSEEEYKTMFLKQNGNCLGCGTNQSKLKKALHVDHCHITGKVRGLLCATCNLALGYAKDNEQILLNLIKYLKNAN